MYNITLSYFVWLFWRSKEHLFRNFFFKFPRARSRDPYRLARVRCACRDLFRSIFCILPKLFHAYRSFDISLTPGDVIDIPNDMLFDLFYMTLSKFWPMTLNLPIWHVFPIQPGGQIHSKSLILLMHSAPFEHGCSIHSSISFSHRGP